MRLKFEPAGRAVGETGKYYQIAKENQCVVCGDSEKYVRKNVVPREYRRYFPRKQEKTNQILTSNNINLRVYSLCFAAVMKDHTSHDVLLLCPRCHQRSNIFDLQVREKLAFDCDAPIASKDGGPMKTIDVPRLRYE